MVSVGLNSPLYYIVFMTLLESKLQIKKTNNTSNILREWSQKSERNVELQITILKLACSKNSNKTDNKKFCFVKTIPHRIFCHFTVMIRHELWSFLVWGDGRESFILIGKRLWWEHCSSWPQNSKQETYYKSTYSKMKKTLTESKQSNNKNFNFFFYWLT